ncbi:MULTISPECIES: sensor histidine kinase [Aestuariibaculum]|uniref:histidine kinase n=1 Tax=Aestuariibaculum lutulentum TaxID=2920935 RepID=A0ABS9RJ59_9FLAO|nr:MULTISPECIES: HAMP domain-containing sensor histidine kinase [Aestuariibaculum]MCH4552989.1 HAMP domain-containing histidine kinase [Aestuariibaculum lutulentum]MCR8669117.1 HAMP domain-containing histidine kinase [Aestuariibaculum sp. M13]
MSKRTFVLLILLMTLSLVGIIFVQAYYINGSIKSEKDRFRFNVNKALYYVSNTIGDNEIANYYNEYQTLDPEKKADSATVSQLLIYQQNNNTKETLIYKSSVLEENYKLTSTLFDIGLDSLDIKSIIGSSSTEVYKNEDLTDKDLAQSPISSIIRSGVISDAQRLVFEKNYKAYLKTTPIHKRVSENEIKDLLTKTLIKDSINLDFEFAIYANDLATKVQSDGFEYDKDSNYSVAIFPDENNRTPYKLLVNFTNDKKFILSSILRMILLSFLFTIIIMITYGGALYQLIKQRKISEIKSDFINNMTHEFKTPIATINLALDAIRNPKIIEDKEKVLRYLGMIKEENKRMHAQVENVLRISKLEKNELNISKERLNLHDLIEDAITHVELIVEDRKGYIKTFLNAEQTSVLANDSHFTNVIVNILDNAVKYSPEAPEIEVYTENVGTNILLKIKDHGSGMSKAAVKRVFEKFYREHTGNIHNVKGHGLGLAYVKRIVEDHQGYVSVESEKDKGSTFTIKLPLIS